MRTTLRLELSSVHAVRAVYTALQAVDGIVHAEVTRTSAVIEHDGRATSKQLREAIAASGHEVLEVVEEKRRLPVKEA